MRTAEAIALIEIPMINEMIAMVNVAIEMIAMAEKEAGMVQNTDQWTRIMTTTMLMVQEEVAAPIWTMDIMVQEEEAMVQEAASTEETLVVQK